MLNRFSSSWHSCRAINAIDRIPKYRTPLKLVDNSVIASTRYPSISQQNPSSGRCIGIGFIMGDHEHRKFV